MTRHRMNQRGSLNFMMALACVPFLLSAGAAALQIVDAKDDPTGSIPQFKKWAAEGPHVEIPVKIHVQQLGLTPHQRLEAKIDAVVDGRQLDKRKGKGNMLFVITLTDSTGKSFPDDGSIDLSTMNSNVRRQNVTMTWRAFLLPG